MTATHVDGKTVVATEQVRSPLSTDENPVFFKRILELLLDDGSTVYGCGDCTHTAASPALIRGHMRTTHSERAVRRRKAKNDQPVTNTEASSDVLDMTIGDLLDLARRAETYTEAIGRLSEDRNSWKIRAQDAERKLAALRKALAP